MNAPSIVLLRQPVTVADVVGRKMVDAMHVDLSRGESMWLGRVEGIARLSVAKGQNRGGAFQRWYVDDKPLRDLKSALAVINGTMTLEDAMREEQKPAKRISLNQQIDEVDRELKMRDDVYPRQVKTGALRESIAIYQIDRLKAVKATLEWLRQNETDIRAYVAARAEARKRTAVSEDNCPGHVASATDPKVCGRCGVHIDALRPPEDEGTAA